MMRLVIVCACLCGAQSLAQLPTEIDVHVTVTDPAAMGLADVPVVLQTSGGSTLAATGQDGTFEFLAVPTNGDAEVFVALSMDSGRGGTLQYADMDRFNQLFREFAWPQWVQVDLIQQQTEYSVELAASDAIKVSGNGKDSLGTSVPIAIAERSGIKGVPSGYGGEFVLWGVEKDQATELVIAQRTGFTVFRSLTALETADDLALGDVVVPVPVFDATAQYTVENAEALDNRTVLRSRVLTLLSSDGAHAFQFLIDEDSGLTMVNPFTPPGDVELLSGDYWVCPGPVFPNALAWKLRDHVREGVLDLEALGVTKLTVLAGQLNVNTVDAGASEAAIQSLP